MEKWIKYILSLNKNEQKRIFWITEKIFIWDFDELDIKAIKWKKGVFRCRVWKFRILFAKQWSKIHILSCDTRWDIYKNL